MKYYYACIECGRGAGAPQTGSIDSESCIAEVLFEVCKKEQLPVASSASECLEYFTGNFGVPDFNEVVIDFCGDELSVLISKDKKKLAAKLGEVLFDCS